MAKIDGQGVYLSHDEYQKLSNNHQSMSEETRNEFEHITELFTVKFDDFKEFIITKLNSIETQTIKTNGSVASLKRWRYLVTGGLTVLIFFLGLLSYIYNLNNNYLKEKMEVLENKISHYDQIIIKE